MEPLNRKLGHFDIREKLGRGGMADVYLAQDTQSGQTVALKLIEHAADADTQQSIDAERRGSLLQKYLAEKDPHVVQIHRWGDLDGYFFVSMEYIAGEDLSELMREEPVACDRAASIAADICVTLENAHTLQATIDGKAFHGIVHGDIKPRNIRIDPSGRVRVIDFGIAKALSLSRRLTRNEFGSVPYASPERLETGDVDAQSDLWSLGVLLYEMVSGWQPYRADSTERLERLIRSRAPFTPLPDSCVEPLRRIIAKALAPDVGRRYHSARELRDDLIAFQEGRPVAAVLEGDSDATRRTLRTSDADDGTRRTATPIPEAVTASARAPAGRPRRHIAVWRVFRWIALAAFLYIAYAMTSGYLLYSHGQELERKISSESVTDPDQMWVEWQKVARNNPGSLLLYGPRRTVRRYLEADGERVVLTYRNNEAQPVYEKGWERARRALGHALELDPGNDKIRGELRLCEAHIARINGTARHNTAQLNDAIQKFQEAAQLLRNSPDPDLGLARVYAYGLRDVEKADAALRNAQKHGYELGNREKAELADGYRDRADRLWADSSRFKGLPQEKDMLKKCKDDYEQALKLYQELAPYANASANIARVQASLDRVNGRLHGSRLFGIIPWS